MKVLMISGDKNILVPGSDAFARLQVQRAAVRRLDVFVWPQIHARIDILRAAKTQHYDVVTAQDPFWRGLLAWRVARRTGAKLNLQVHADLSAQSLSRRLLARFLLRRADSVRVVSDAIREQVQSFGVTVPICVLAVYIDITRFTALAPLPHDQKTILWIGRFEAEKDPQEALQVLKTARKQGIDAKLVMLGTGSLEPTVRESARELPVEFPGWQDPAEYLPTADVVLCTSRHESWGASMVEALAAGVPVVASDVGIAREAGAIVAARSDLAEAVCDVLSTGKRGRLFLLLPTQDEWVTLWKKTLV